MKLKRAQEILASPDTIEVRYHGTPIWIKTLDAGTGMANVTAENLPERVVPIVDLHEKK